MRFNYKAPLGGLFLVCVGCALLFYGKATADQPYTFMSFDYPDAVSTTLFGINNSGDVVGSYENPANYFHGFVYSGGQFTSIDGPGAAFTQIRGINDEGDIVGTFITLEAVLSQAPGGGFQGLSQKNGGSLTTLNVPGHLNTIFQSITTGGLIYGCFHDEGFDNTPQETMHGIITQLEDFPNGSFSAMPEGTTMNGGGNPEATRFTGQWYDFTMNRHRAYVIENGQRLDFDVPGSNLTIAWDMNASGEAVGVWGDQDGHPDPEATSAGNYHGFLRDSQGNFTAIDYPASVDTKAFGINNRGDIVGSYVDADGNGHGFISRKGDLQAEMRKVRAGLGSMRASSPAARPSIAKVSLGDGSARTDAVPAVRVAFMPVIPRGKPLQAPAQAPACHQVRAK